MVMTPIPSVSIANHPEFAVVTNDPHKYGIGVFSWHYERKAAEHNAKATGGTVVPVDYINGELIVPALATNLIDKALGL
jgi:hypothetical protein